MDGKLFSVVIADEKMERWTERDRCLSQVRLTSGEMERWIGGDDYLLKGCLQIGR